MLDFAPIYEYYYYMQPHIVFKYIELGDLKGLIRIHEETGNLDMIHPFTKGNVLHVALSIPFSEAAEYIIENDLVDFTLLDGFGRSAFDIAQDTGNRVAMRLIMDKLSPVGLDELAASGP